MIVARCQGHQSWVTAVAFDPWRCDDRNYRFGSVGEDCRLLLWDFNVGMLHRPKAVGSNYMEILRELDSNALGFGAAQKQHLLTLHKCSSESRNSDYDSEPG